MKALLIKAWHDPVGSKVISWGIIAGLTALGLWAWSGFSSSLAVVWASTLAVWSWLAGPMTLPIGIVLLTVITFAALCWWLIEQRRRAVKEIADRSAKVILDTIDEAKEKIRAEVQKAEVSQLVKNAKVSLDLTDKDKEALQVIYSQYPKSMEIDLLAVVESLTYPATERLCEKLEALGFVKCIPAGHNPTSVILTKPGRDYCIENDLV